MAADFTSLFDGASEWQVFASGQAEGRLSDARGPSGERGLRLDYDFHGGGGFVAIRRTIALRLPDAFEIGFNVRGEGSANTLEFKVAAPGGADVWRCSWPEFAPPADWSGRRLTERELAFAWGPAGGGAPSEVEAVELVVVAGPGGRGSLAFGGARFADQSLTAPAGVWATSAQGAGAPESLFGRRPGAGWRAAADDAQPRLEVDFGRVQRFGGLVVHWPEPLPPRTFEIEAFDGGDAWRLLWRGEAVCGARTHVPTPRAEARRLRVTFADAACAAVGSLELRPDAFSHTPHAFIHAVAADFPRGWFPRYWLREQSYWTVVGAPEGTRRGLINEEGLIETDEAGFSLEPFVLTAAGPVTWADVRTSAALPRGGAPLPSVTWETASFSLEIGAWVEGRGEAFTLRASYRLERREAAGALRLAVAVRPYQVTPPWQAFRNLGGQSRVCRVRCSDEGVDVDGRRVTAAPRPIARGCAAFAEAEAPAVLAQGAPPRKSCVEDASGLASAEMVWELPQGASVLEVTLAVPYSGGGAAADGGGRAAARARWNRTLGKVVWHVPPCAAAAVACFRTAAGQILINRDGAALQPGPRRYTRSWIRDGVIMGAALAKAGYPRALREFLSWYAPFQREDGFVPCVVDRDGVDGLVEHDSHGQFLWGVREVAGQGGGAAFARRMMPRVRKAAEYLMTLRASRTTEAYRVGRGTACFGLLPESASHEGYLAHPVHAYWDDFWGVRGLEAAAELAAAEGMRPEAARWREEAARFQTDLIRSIERVVADRGLAYVPGSVEWADFDPTATANAVSLLDFADALPQAPLRAMLATYLEGFRRKRDGVVAWNNYTAYEVRLIGALVRLGERDAAHELLSFLLLDRRPCAWNQWPEITWREPRCPGHLGDLPHTWIAAEYMLSLASMVACERGASESLVLASGLPWAWIAEGTGFAVRGLLTRYGALDFAARAPSQEAICVAVGGGLVVPPGGLRVALPLPAGRRVVAVEVGEGEGALEDATGSTVAVLALPFTAELRLA